MLRLFLIVGYSLILLCVMKYLLTPSQALTMMFVVLVTTPILLIPEIYAACRKSEHFTSMFVPPPTFDTLLGKIDDTPQQQEMEGASEAEKEKLHSSRDPYDFVSEKPEYQKKDLLYFVNKGDLVDREWTQFYTVLDTKHWKPYVSPPPVCLDRQDPCSVCPIVAQNSYLDLSEVKKTNVINEGSPSNCLD